MIIQMAGIVASGILLAGIFAAAIIVTWAAQAARKRERREYREEFRKTWE